MAGSDLEEYLFEAEPERDHFDNEELAIHWQSFTFTAETYVEFEPEDYQQMAGLICLYDTENYYYLRISSNDEEQIWYCF